MRRWAGVRTLARFCECVRRAPGWVLLSGRGCIRRPPAGCQGCGLSCWRNQFGLKTFLCHFLSVKLWVTRCTQRQNKSADEFVRFDGHKITRRSGRNADAVCKDHWPGWFAGVRCHRQRQDRAGQVRHAALCRGFPFGVGVCNVVSRRSPAPGKTGIRWSAVSCHCLQTVPLVLGHHRYRLPSQWQRLRRLSRECGDLPVCCL